MQQVQQELQEEALARRQRGTLGGKTAPGSHASRQSKKNSRENSSGESLDPGPALLTCCRPACQLGQMERGRSQEEGRREWHGGGATAAQSVLPGTEAEPRLRLARRKRAGGGRG